MDIEASSGVQPPSYRTVFDVHAVLLEAAVDVWVNDMIGRHSTGPIAMQSMEVVHTQDGAMIDVGDGCSYSVVSL